MTKFISLHSAIRIVSITLVAAIIFFLLFLSFSFPKQQALFLALSAGSLICLVFPTSCGNVKLSMWYSVAAAAVIAIMIAVGVNPVLMIVADQILLIVYLMIAGMTGVASIEEIIRIDVVWKGVELFAKMFYAVLYMVILSAGQALMDSVWLWLCCALSLALFFVLYIRDYFATTVFVSFAMEKKIRMIGRRDIRPRLEDPSCEKSKLSIVYERAVNAVESKRLYLEPKYSLAALSKEVFCNKTFLSRSINAFSGKGFCYFMNAFRIRYAMELLQKDHKILMKELAYMSGFSNVVTFNMSFKAVTGSTPTEYVDSLRAELLRPSRKVEQVR